MSPADVPGLEPGDLVVLGGLVLPREEVPCAVELGVANAYNKRERKVREL